ncbi:fluoride efflux transporter FluC [Haloarchaeobius amylolyticus]|uniref:fluoride efflux transporter FluC n=1 Tax=Haloarchaeobius amylolyticus TaxID=1198296 RepID=UPI0022717897|nr:CrcB family protein [Haloarchaeobius amylolyticus]
MTDDHPLATVETLALVALGGFAGANARFVVDQGLSGLPTGLVGTLVANVCGCVLLGFVLYEEVHVGVFSRQLRVAIGTGFLSSFTTYSTFAVQTATSAPLLALANVGANYALGFAGVVIGRWLALSFAAEVDA